MPGAYEAWIDQGRERDRLWRRRFESVLGGVRPGRLLDVGAGIGTFLAMARDEGWEPHGTEVSATAISHAATLGIALTRGELESAAVKGPFDAITLWHVLEHVPEPRATLRRCRDLMAQDGRLILAMPNDGGPGMVMTRVGDLVRRVLRRTRSPRYLVLAPGVESHIQHFDVGSITRLLRSEGLRVERLDVDDASPTRSRLGGLVFRVRRFLTRRTPWHWGREMLIVARPTKITS